MTLSESHFIVYLLPIMLAGAVVFGVTSDNLRSTKSAASTIVYLFAIALLGLYFSPIYFLISIVFGLMIFVNSLFWRRKWVRLLYMTSSAIWWFLLCIWQLSGQII